MLWHAYCKIDIKLYEKENLISLVVKKSPANAGLFLIYALYYKVV